MQTADNLISAFEKKTGITVVVRSDDEDTLADQIAAEGSQSPADVFFTENSPPLESLQAKGLLSAGRLVNAGADAEQVQLAAGRLGRRLGPGQRASSTTPSLISPASCPRTSRSSPSPQYKGKLALAPGETDFQPIVTAYQRAYGTAATLTWLKKIQRERSRAHLSRQ